MLRSRHAALTAAALLCTPLAATSAAAQVQVTLRALAPPQAFFVADLMPGSSAARPDLIAITLVSSPAGEATGRASAAAGPTISLEINVSRESPSPAQIFHGTTDPFVLATPVRNITLRELASTGRDVSITDFDVNEEGLDGPNGRTGRLPAGTYLFRVTVHDQRGGSIDSDELRIGFTSPSRVELLSPGAPADVAPPVVLGPTPRFLWSGDPAERYRLRVVKVENNTSATEAMEGGFASWDVTVAGTSALYPASVEALRLEPGATYAWQVVRELRTTGGTETIESPIYWFRVGGGGGRPPPNALDLRFAALLRALGLAELQGYTPVGATLEDGRPFRLDKLEDLLTAIAAGEIAVLAARVR